MTQLPNPNPNPKPVNPLQSLKNLDDWLIQRVEKLLPPYLSDEKQRRRRAEQLILGLYVFISQDRNKNLAEAVNKNPYSFLSAVYELVPLNLDFDGNHILLTVSYNRKTNQVGFAKQIGYKGRLLLLQRNPNLHVYRPVAVNVSDAFEYETVLDGGGYQQKIRHRPDLSAKDLTMETLKCGYIAWRVRNPDGSVMEDNCIVKWSEINKAREFAKQKGGAAVWDSWFEQKVLITILKRAAQFMPVEAKYQMERVDEIEADDLDDDNDDANYHPGAAAAPTAHQSAATTTAVPDEGDDDDDEEGDGEVVQTEEGATDEDDVGGGGGPFAQEEEAAPPPPPPPPTAEAKKPRRRRAPSPPPQTAEQGAAPPPPPPQTRRRAAAATAPPPPPDSDVPPWAKGGQQ